MPDAAKRYTYYKSDGFEIWGKEYRNTAEDVTWRLRVFSDQDRRIETHEVVAGTLPQCRRIGEGKAVQDAIAAWSQES